MKQEGYVSTSKLITDTLWVIVGALVLAGWVIGLATHDFKIPLMLVGTASTLSAAAAVAHIRCYAVNITTMIRVTSGLTPSKPPAPSEDGAVHRIH